MMNDSCSELHQLIPKLYKFFIKLKSYPNSIISLMSNSFSSHFKLIYALETKLFKPRKDNNFAK